MTFRMCTKCSCWEHVKQSVPVLAMFLTCYYLFPGTLAPSVSCVIAIPNAIKSQCSLSSPRCVLVSFPLPLSPRVLVLYSVGSLMKEEHPRSLSHSHLLHPPCVVCTRPSTQLNSSKARDRVCVYSGELLNQIGQA